MHEKQTLSRIIEAVLFASDTPVEASRLVDIVEGIADEAALLPIINDLNRQFDENGHSFRIVEVAGGFQFETLAHYGPFVEKLYRSKPRPKLSRASLETLAIVAYKQPVSKPGVDALRGVDSDASIQTLQNRDLIEVTGTGDTPGKPRLYGTTREFLRYFGLKDLKDLPGADDLASMFDGTEIEEPVPGQLSFEPYMDVDAGTQADDAAAGTDNGEA